MDNLTYKLKCMNWIINNKYTTNFSMPFIWVSYDIIQIKTWFLANKNKAKQNESLLTSPTSF